MAHNARLADQVASVYKDRFGAKPEVLLFSPGRINLIGEHTDYNNGFVMPAAVGYGIYFAIGKANSDSGLWVALDKQEEFESRREAEYVIKKTWTDYVYGAWLSMREALGGFGGFNCVFTSDLPDGAGMSSSSALTCGILYGLNLLYDGGIARIDLVQRAFNVERGFVGVKGGIMDQFACLMSKRNHFILLDCSDNSHRLLPFRSESVTLFLVNSNVRRELSSSEYNTRSRECSDAVEEIRKRDASVGSLRDVSPKDLDEVCAYLSPTFCKRTRHVVEENKRVLDCVELIGGQDWEGVGKILHEGHAGLRDLFEVSIPEIDFLAEFCESQDWVYGSRLMGGGFGGCTVNIAEKLPDEEFIFNLTKEYNNRFNISPKVIHVSPVDGAYRI